MQTLDEFRQTIAAEKQQFQDYKASTDAALADKDSQIAAKDARIAELEAQVGNPQIPDDIVAEVQSIVP